VVGPKSISEPCDESSKSHILFDASYSSDPSKRQLVSIQWSQSGAPDPTLQVSSLSNLYAASLVGLIMACAIHWHEGLQCLVSMLPVFLSFQSLMDTVNAETKLRAQSKLKLPGNKIAMLPDGNYSLVVTVTNFLSASSSSSLTFSKSGAGAAPVVSIQGGDQQVGATRRLQSES